MLPWASHVTSVGRPNRYFWFSTGPPGVLVWTAPATGSGRRPSTITTRPCGVELDHHVRPLVDDPDVVLRIDAHLVRELDAVETDAPLLHEVAVRVELEQPGVAAAVVHEHVSLRVRRDADAFAEVEVRRKLEEIRHRRVRNDGNVFSLRFGLGRQLRPSQQNDDHDTQGQSTPHTASRKIRIDRSRKSIPNGPDIQIRELSRRGGENGVRP